MKKVRLAFILLGGLFLAVLVGMGQKMYNRQRIMEQRIADVKVLGSLYLECIRSNVPPSMLLIVGIVHQRGVKLNEPIPKDATQPSYKIVSSTNYESSSDPAAILIEETENVADNQIVRLYGDGSIRLEKRR